VSAFYASQFARCAAVLDSAALLADDRITQSVSREGLALVTNDLARPYQPRRTERLFIPYYSMLAYARLGEWEDAAVEARRLNQLLLAYSSDQTTGEKPTHAMLYYLAATVLERAGESEDAAVSYRLARATAPEMVDSVTPALEPEQGEVLVVVERGFVAHRATGAIELFLGDDDAMRGDRGRRRHRDDGDGGDDDDYWLSIAFPTLRRGARPASDPMISVDDIIATGPKLATLLDDASAADEQRERTALVARATTRAVAKFALTKAVKDRKGEVAGKLANIGLSLMERADVRSWHLLPQSITAMRIRVPAGTHHVRVAVNGAMEDLGPVTVRPGAVSLVTTRLFADHGPRVLAAH
jgi:hypothetical protein